MSCSWASRHRSNHSMVWGRFLLGTSRSMNCSNTAMIRRARLERTSMSDNWGRSLRLELTAMSYLFLLRGLLRFRCLRIPAAFPAACRFVRLGSSRFTVAIFRESAAADIPSLIKVRIRFCFRAILSASLASTTPVARCMT